MPITFVSVWSFNLFTLSADDDKTPVIKLHSQRNRKNLLLFMGNIKVGSITYTTSKMLKYSVLKCVPL